jgi:hypothetical protein
MSSPTPLHRLVRLLPLALLGTALASSLPAAGAAASAPSAQPATPAAPASRWDLADFIDGLPDLLAERLPGFDRTGVLRLYVRPHFGDLIRRDYLRVPFGARAKITENFEGSGEFQTYFTHGISDAAGYGLSGLRLGAKCEHVLPSLNDGAGFSLGLNFQTPLSRPPQDLTDGHRHTQPYVAATRPLIPDWKLLGFASVGADLLDRTPMPAHFGRNQLHANSLIFVAGAAREWPRFRASLTATLTTSSLLSNENKHVYALRPEIVVPWKVRPAAHTQILLTLGGRTLWGPDGHELGLSSSVRIEFLLRRDRGSK